MIVNPTNYKHLESYSFITAFSDIINNSLCYSIFNEHEQKIKNFTTLLMSAFNTYVIIPKLALHIIMDAYCLITMFATSSDDITNNIIINACIVVLFLHF